MVLPLSADVHIFAGDLFDHMREANQEQRDSSLRRFEAAFPRQKGKIRLIAAGNHDVGLGRVRFKVATSHSVFAILCDRRA